MASSNPTAGKPSPRSALAPGPLAWTPEEWTAEVTRLGERAFRGKQVFRWIHARNVMDPALMSDLPAAFRAKLAEAATNGGSGLGSVISIAGERRASDDTRKLLVSFGDGANVETVLIP